MRVPDEVGAMLLLGGGERDAVGGVLLALGVTYPFVSILYNRLPTFT